MIIRQEVWNQQVDENGNLIVDETGTPILIYEGTEIINEPDPVPMEKFIFLGELDEDPFPLKMSTSWILNNGTNRIWKKYGKDKKLEEVIL